ncbi:MAG: PepSY domain-containing protein [Oscillospiraceae bacterium]|nr:PepSY domain-containing protein [Oscillospiraceae bacterium]
MPENENNQSPKKKRGFLWVIIIILIVVLAAVIGGYALSQYYGTPAWLSGILPGTEVVEPVPSAQAVEAPAATFAPAEATPALPESTPAAPEEGVVPAPVETPVATAVPTPAVTATQTIGADAAAEAALKHSKVNEKDADISSVLLVEQNGMMLYEVCFSTKDNQYEYLLDASTGRVESWRKAALADAVTEPAIAASGDLKPTASPEPTASPAPEKNATVLIGEDEAKKLAMGHANITEKDLSSISCKLELEGLNLIYDIEMKTKLMEYDYEVDAISGEVIGFDIEPLKK